MKKELRTPIWIVLMVFALTLATFTFVTSIISFVNTIRLYNGLDDSYYLASAFSILLTDVIIFPFFMTLITIFSKKRPILLIPLGLLVAQILVSQLIYFFYDLSIHTVVWYSIILLSLSLGSFILSLIGFIATKPLAREGKEAKAENSKGNDDYFEEVSKEPTVSTNKKVSFDDILKAKELFDAGAITQEEFTEIKRRAIG